MTYLPFAIFSYFLNSIAVTVDKFLLAKAIPDPLIYVFYLSFISLFALFGIPFVSIPSFEVFLFASSSTLLWVLGAYLMFKALKSYQLQRVIPAIGTFTALILLLIGIYSISLNEALAAIILILGLIFLTLNDWKGKTNLSELTLEISSAFFLALNYFLLREAFLREDFFTVLVWSRPILIPIFLFFVLVPYLRKIVLPYTKPKSSPLKRNVFIFIFGQISAGLSELLLVFSISLANPAIINSLQGIKFIFLLIFSLILGIKFPEIFKIKLTPYILISQIAGIGLIGLGLYLLAFSS